MYNNDYLYNPKPIVAEPEGLEKIFGAATGVMIALLIVLILVLIAVAVIMIIANCKLLSKAGEKWWKGLIPVYANWVFNKISGLAWWWFLIVFVLTAISSHTGTITHIDSLNGAEYQLGFNNYVIYMGILLSAFNLNFSLAKKFGKSNGFAVLLTLLPVIGYPILAFGSAKYNKDAKVDQNGIFSIEK